MKAADSQPRSCPGHQGPRRDRRFSRDGASASSKWRPKSDAAHAWPVYVHFGQLWGLPESGHDGEDVDTILTRVIPLLQPGDVLAHPFTRHPGGVRQSRGRGASGDPGRARPRIEGGCSAMAATSPIVWRARPLPQGIIPTTLGADIHGYNTHVPAPAGTPDEHIDEENHPFAGQAKFSLVQAMSSMMALGLTLEQVVPMVTSRPAEMLGPVVIPSARCAGGYGADVSVLDAANMAASSCATTRRTKSWRKACCSQHSVSVPACAHNAVASDPAASRRGVASQGTRRTRGSTWCVPQRPARWLP